MTLPSAFLKAQQRRSSTSSQEILAKARRAKHVYASLKGRVKRTYDNKFRLVPAKDWESLSVAIEALTG